MCECIKGYAISYVYHVRRNPHINIFVTWTPIRDTLPEHTFTWTPTWLYETHKILTRRRNRLGIICKRTSLPFRHTCIRLCYKCMYLTYRYHCEGPHTLILLSSVCAFILVIIAEYYKKYPPEISSLTSPIIFRISKKPEYMWKPCSSRSFKQNFIKIGRETKKL